jgi:DNA-binding MarR family transcriptional regulator
MHYENVVSAWVLHAHDALVAAAEEEELDPRELAALTLISSHAGSSIEWLRPRVGLTQSGTVRLVDRLESEGLVRRGGGTGRAVALTLTRAGAARLVRWNAARERERAKRRRPLAGVDPHSPVPSAGAGRRCLPHMRLARVWGGMPG